MSRMECTTGRSRRKLQQNDGWGGIGGYMHARLSKLEDQFEKEKEKADKEHTVESSIFRGVTVHVNGYTKPTSNEIKTLMANHGGQFAYYYSRAKVTHTIASNLPFSKIRKLKPGQMVVRPEWITDSITAGKLLSTLPYEQYANTRGQTNLNFAKQSPDVEMTEQLTEDGSDEEKLPVNGTDDVPLERLSAFTPLVPNARLTPVKCELNSQLATPSPSVSSRKLFDSKTPAVFEPKNASTPFVGRTEPTDEDVEEWLNMPSQETPSIHRKRSTESRSSKYSHDLFDSSGDESRKCDSRASRKRLKLNLETAQKVSPEQQMTDSPFLENGDELSLRLSDSDDEGVNEMEEIRHEPEQNEIMEKMEIGEEHDQTDSLERKKSPQKTAPLVDCVVKKIEGGKKVSPTKRALRAGDANFVAEFYNNSRLHHLSTWGAEFKDYVSHLQSQGDPSFPGRQRLAEALNGPSQASSQDSDDLRKEDSTVEKVIMHIDMDCFFVAVGLVNRPELRGKPIAVTHSKGGADPSRVDGQNRKMEREMYMKRKLAKSKVNPGAGSSSVDGGSETPSLEKHTSMADIASCSYEARKAGVKNGMFVGKAMQLCPDLVTIPYDFDGYNRVSRTLYDTVASYTHQIEAVSCDEMFVDCTEVLSSVKCTGTQFADFLRREIEDKTQCTASAGLGPNILLARLATRVAKPNGSHHLPKEGIADFMKKQQVKDLPGVGWSTSHRLTSLGVVTCGDLQHLSLAELRREFGQKAGLNLFRTCRGEDDRQVKSDKIRKSVSAEINYGIRFTENDEAHQFIRELAEEVTNRLVKLTMAGKCITLKLRIRSEGAPKETSKFGGHGVCDSVSKSSVLSLASAQSDVIARECIQLYRAVNCDPSDLRGMGIQISKLVSEDKTKIRQNTIMDSFVKKAVHVMKPPEAVPTSSKTAVATSSTSIVSTSSKTSGSATSCTIDVATSPVAGPSTSARPPVANKTPRRHLLDKDQFLVSPSQVDPDVLNELPIHLQRQIRAEMQRIKPRPPAADARISPAVAAERPGCSHWVSGEGRSDGGGDEPKDAVVAEELPSFSQVDQECLDALPDNIRDEILTAYAARKSRNAIVPAPAKTTSTKTVRLTWKNNVDLKSPRKKSPRKSPKKSPAKAKPIRKKPKLTTSRKPTTNDLHPPTSVTSSRPQNVAIIESKPVALCDAVSLKDVKSLVSEWMMSCAQPEAPDLRRFETYMYELVKDHNLEQVILLLRFVQRKSTNLQHWQSATTDLISTVQSYVFEQYGAPLKLNA